MSIDEIVRDQDDKFYLTEKKSEECQCGRWKKPGNSLCAGCWHRLPVHMQADLYARLGDGYEEAYDQAVKYLSA